jgi:hypothetical protein
MAIKDQARSSKSGKPKRSNRNVGEADENRGTIAKLFLIAMAGAAFIAVLVGQLWHGFDWSSLLHATWILALAIAFMTIALLEIEWLERIVCLVEGGYWSIYAWVWYGSPATLSDSDLLGRRGARTVWMLFAVGTFAFGCLVALRMFEF